MSIIKRVYLKALWYKKTYPFYWAHKPMCGLYRDDVVRFKKIYLCRSCLFVYLGIGFGILYPILFPAIYTEYGLVSIAALSVFTLPFSYPSVYKRLSRRFRDLLRFSLGCITVQIVYLFFKGFILPALTVLIFCYILWKIYFTKRAKRKLQLCHDCEEFSYETVCSGYTLQTKLLREYEEEATEYILKTGYIPKAVQRFDKR